MRSRSVTCQLGPTRATLVTNHQRVLDYLRNFYTMSDGAAPGAWEVEATVGPEDPNMTINEWGVGFASDPAAGRLRLRAPDPESLAVTARTSIREALVDYCERRRYVMLHASAVVDDRRVIVIVGDHGSGKTTLGLKSVLSHRMRYLANEHLIVYEDRGADGTAGVDRSGGVDGIDNADDASGLPVAPSRLRLTTLPGPIALRIGTYLDLEELLPPPFDTEGLDVDAYRAVPRERRYRSTDRVIYTFHGLGQSHPATVDLRDPEAGPVVLVVLAGYRDRSGDGPGRIGDCGDPAESVAGDDRAEPALEPVPDRVAALMPHLRTDWMFTPQLNQRYLPRTERRPDEYLADARRLLGALAQRATVVRWRHHGDPAPLLAALTAGG